MMTNLYKRKITPGDFCVLKWTYHCLETVSSPPSRTTHPLEILREMYTTRPTTSTTKIELRVLTDTDRGGSVHDLQPPSGKETLTVSWTLEDDINGVPVLRFQT